MPDIIHDPVNCAKYSYQHEHRMLLQRRVFYTAEPRPRDIGRVSRNTTGFLLEKVECEEHLTSSLLHTISLLRMQLRLPSRLLLTVRYSSLSVGLFDHVRRKH